LLQYYPYNQGKPKQFRPRYHRDESLESAERRQRCGAGQSIALDPKWRCFY
jgi:hypothetical protein